MQQQVEQRQQLEVLTQRLDRSVSVVQNAEAMQAARGKVVAVTEATRAPFPAVNDKDRFRLDSQRTLAGIAQRGGVSVTLFDWVLDGEAAQAGMAYGRVNASLSGPLDSLVAVHGAIEAEMPYAAVREVKLDSAARRQSLASAKDPGTLALVMDLYYRPATAAGPRRRQRRPRQPPEARSEYQSRTLAAGGGAWCCWRWSISRGASTCPATCSRAARTASCRPT